MIIVGKNIIIETEFIVYVKPDVISFRDGNTISIDEDDFKEIKEALIKVGQVT